MVALGLVEGRLRVRMILKRIEIAKDLFILEIEQGNDSFILKDISQKQLPMSY